MGEKELVADGESITYDGIFKPKDLVAYMRKISKDMGYDLAEKSHNETVGENGKTIEIKYESSKNATDYIKKKFELKVKFDSIKEKIVEEKKQKVRYQTGKITLTIDASVNTDYEDRWGEKKPAFYLFRQFFEKYVYSSYGKKIKAELRDEVNRFKDEMSAYMNLIKY